MLVSIPSNRPKRLRATLLNVLEVLRADRVAARVLLVDGSDEIEENGTFAQEAYATFGIPVDVVSEFSYQRSFRDFAYLFTGPYGGPRNVALAEGVLAESNVVFLDDDVVPSEGFFARFEELLLDNAIVVGASSGQRTGSALLVDKLHRALDDFSHGRISPQKARTLCREAFCGLSDEWPPSVESYGNGCLGVSSQVASRYCFFPTRYRAEDALFCELSRFFVGENAFKPFLPDAPVGYHKPERGPLDTLTHDYVNFLHGSTLTFSIQYLLQHFGPDFTPAALDLACAKGPQAHAKEFGPDRMQARKKRQKTYEDALAALDDADLSKAFARLVGVSLEQASPSDLRQQIERFFHVQAQWKRFLALRAEASDPV